MRLNRSPAAGPYCAAEVFSGRGMALTSASRLEGIDLVEYDDGHHQSIAHLRRGDGAAQADDGIDVIGAVGRTDGFHQQIEVRRIARHQQVGFQPLDGQHPAQLAHQVAVFALGQNGVKGLLGRSCRRCPSRPVAWANSFSAARFGKRASTRPMA